MTIKDILDHKGADVVSVDPRTPVLDIARILTERRIGAVLVLDEASRLLGILTERDIIGAVARGGADGLSRSAAEIMTEVRFTVSRQTTIPETMRIMTDQRVRHLPVMEGQTLLGLVSIGDIVKARLDQQEHEVQNLRSYVFNVS